MLDRPATSGVIAICAAAFLLIHRHNLSYADVGCSFDLVVRQLQLWRLLTAQLSHVSGLHLLFNCSALWNIGAVESGQHAAGSGSLWYISTTLLFLVLSALGVIGLYAVAILGLRRDHLSSTTMVGYSCVVFAWMAYLAASAGASSTYSIVGLTVPAHLMPFAALVLTSAIVPQASFLGHLAGIIAGYLVAILPEISFFQSITIFALFLSAVVWSVLRQQHELRERFASWLPSFARASSAEVDIV